MFRGDCEKHEPKEHGDVYGFLRREPRAGKLARGVPGRGGGSNITSLFNVIEGGHHFENLILGILMVVLDGINKKYGLEFDSSCLGHTAFTYEFALPYLSGELDEMGFTPSLRAQIIAEFHSWKVVMNQKSTFLQ